MRNASKNLVGRPEGKNQLGRFSCRWQDNIRTDLRNRLWRIGLRIGTSGGFMRARYWTFGFHEGQGISWLAEWLLSFQEGLCSMEWISHLATLMNFSRWSLYVVIFVEYIYICVCVCVCVCENLLKEFWRYTEAWKLI
jgi:hypothetical protein